jgi:hypothetical protein
MKCKNCNEKDAVKYSKYSNGEFCSRKCARGFSTKAKRKEINEKVSKTLTKEKIIKICPVCGDGFQNSNKKFCSFLCYSRGEKPKVTEITRNKLSLIAKKRNFGGHTSKNAVYYKMKNGSVVYLHSSYEEKLAISLDKNNVKWIRPEPLRYVGNDDKEHRYYADFYLKDYDIYLDTKNDYLIQKDKDKIRRVQEQNKKTIMVLDRNHLEWSSVLVSRTTKISEQIISVIV